MLTLHGGMRIKNILCLSEEYFIVLQTCMLIITRLNATIVTSFVEQ